jgi:glutamate 5-kinase
MNHPERPTVPSPARGRLREARRIIVKVGSAVLTSNGSGLQHDLLAGWVAELAALVAAGRQVVVVTSGAVAEGVARLGWGQRPTEVHRLQAAAAVGQTGLVQAWESAFQRHGLPTAQVLLTHADLSDRQRYLNARITLRTLLEARVVPVINENDTVATDEIRFGDNDTLSALVANLLEADLLIILTDQAGMYERDPRSDPTARLILETGVDDPGLEAMAGEGGAWGRGGMRTKVTAARLAARSGTATVIASGCEAGILPRVLAAQPVGTLFVPSETRVAARKRWLAGGLKVRGELRLDAGAAAVLERAGRSLLAVGVTEVIGDFRRGELVICRDPEGREVARGLANYSAEEARSIRGQPSDRIGQILGYVAEPELIHRDNLVVGR